MTHPLTDDFCYQIVEDWPPEDDVEKDNMRSAADWQLDQVMKWLEERLTDYSDTEVWNCIDNLHRLRSDLKKAMRPTTQEATHD